MASCSVQRTMQPTGLWVPQKTGRLTAAAVLLAVVAVKLEARRPAFEVTAVRYWSLAETTRVDIEVTGEGRIRSDRVRNPDRIFFDFVGAKPSIDGHRSYSSEVGDKLLKRIRVAETSPGVTRVVLDLKCAAEFTVSRLENPSRGIIEVMLVSLGFEQTPKPLRLSTSQPLASISGTVFDPSDAVIVGASVALASGDR